MGHDSLAARYAPNASSPDYKIDNKQHYAEVSKSPSHSVHKGLRLMTVAMDGNTPHQPVQHLR